ncbi:uncharacterized protein [Dermacentor albipictus]|uniref:uncharacterized protein n=1 Tax=Dermacentor albipictus TaxID=60249 RepID=UPI0031FD81C5
MESHQHQRGQRRNPEQRPTKRQRAVSIGIAPSPETHVAGAGISGAGATRGLVIMCAIFVSLGLIVACVVFIKTKDDFYSPPASSSIMLDSNPVICVYNDTLEAHITFPEDGLCNFVIFMSIYYVQGENTTRRRSGDEQEKGTLGEYNAVWKEYHKTAFLAGFPSEYVDKPQMIASQGFAEAIAQFSRTANCRGHGIFYAVSRLVQLESSMPKLRLFFLALVAQMRLMAGDSFILFFGLTFVNTRGRFPAEFLHLTSHAQLS